MHSILLLSLFFIRAKRTLKVYNPDEKIEIYPIETPYVWLTLFDWLPRFRAFTEPAKYFGSLIAGQAEFPWVVDVRCEELDAEGWGIGNLITGFWVLTACSILRDWEFVEECGGLSLKNNYAIYFCTNYINEDYTRYNEKNEVVYRLKMGHDSHGKRTIAKIKKHPKCDSMKRIYNFALLKVNQQIPIYVPVTGYMPLYGNPDTSFGDINFNRDSLYEKLYHMDGFLPGYKKLVCYVASFGRPYNNVLKPQNLDYKVKYRAYFAEYDYCINDNYKLHLRLCYNNGNEPRNFSDKKTINDTCVKSLKKFGDSNAYITISQPKFKRQFMCFRTYSKHGAVCDVDRGAPLVCDGEVYGFVGRGVPWEYCVNARMFPFIVIKADALKGSRLYRHQPLEPDFGSTLNQAPELVEPQYSYAEITN